jgi:hypothetical protein
MQNAYTSSVPNAICVLKLQKLGLLEFADSGKRYVTSAKGRALLEEWQKISAL